MLIRVFNEMNEEPEKIWPEMIRLLTAHADERHEVDLEVFEENSYISELLKKVGSCTPQSFTWTLTYREKIDLLLFMVDRMHDLDSFRQFLNKRLDEKSSLFKQKNDIHA